MDMLDRKIKNISTQELESVISELLTEKLGENNFQVEIKNMEFGFEFDYKTEICMIVKESAFEIQEKSDEKIDIHEDIVPF